MMSRLLLAHPDKLMQSVATKNIYRDQRGTVAIEFAFVAGLFLTLLFGVIVFGFQFAGRIALSYAVSEGARAAVSGLTDAERETSAIQAMNDALSGYSGLLLNADPQVSIATVGTQKQITVSIPASAIRIPTLPFVPDLSALPAVSTTYYVTDPSN